MSQDKFWEQWGSNPTGDKPPEPEKPPQDSARAADEGEPDALTAWLRAIPPNEPILAPVAPAPHGPTASPAELAELWPPAAPVDPFAGIQNSPGAGSDWDLAFEDGGVPSAPSGPVTAAPPPAVAPPVPPVATPPVPAAPPRPGLPSAPPLGEFALDLGGLGGPAPSPSPFQAPDLSIVTQPPHAAPERPPAVVSPFGPPPPPMPPPQEALQAPPLRLEINTGRRTVEKTIQGEALIGRPDTTRGIHPEIDLRLDDAVSRRHAKIFVRDGRYVLTDLNSTNGTRHNEQWLQPEVEVPLAPGDEIEVGEATLIRVLEAPASNA